MRGPFTPSPPPEIPTSGRDSRGNHGDHSLNKEVKLPKIKMTNVVEEQQIRSQSFVKPDTPLPDLSASSVAQICGRGDKKRRKRDKPSNAETAAKKKAKESMIAEEQYQQVVRGKAQFNRNTTLTLPSIGQKPTELHSAIKALPKIFEAVPPSGPHNNIVDIINRHDASVRTTAIMKEIGADFMRNVSRFNRQDYVSNNAPEIIAENEDIVGRAYDGKRFPSTAGTGSNAPRSRCTSGKTRKAC